MAGMIGPISLTVGQPYQLNLSLDTTRVIIDNDSPYDVWFAFRTDAPPVVSVSSGQWHGIMRRGHTGMVPVFGRAASAREASLNAIGSFAGVLWLLAVNPGGLASNGTISVRTNVFVTPLSPNDPDPVYSALATQVDLTSQPRVVSVPIVVDKRFAIQSVSIATAVLGFYLVGAPTPAQLSAQRATLYLYWLQAYLTDYVVGHADLSFVLQFYPGDSFGVPIAGSVPFDVYAADLTASLGTVTTGNAEFRSVERFFPAQPLAMSVTWVGNPNTPNALCARIIRSASSGTANLLAQAGLDMDNSNVVSTPGNIGNNALQTFGASVGDPNIF